MILRKKAAPLPGPHFHTAAFGGRFEFTHPATGVQHTLLVQEYEQKEISPLLTDAEVELPAHCTVMSYTLSPDLSDDSFTVMDCAGSDPPRQSAGDTGGQSGSSVCTAGIIYGEAEPAVSDDGSPIRLHTACSALHFVPDDNVEWRMVFYEKSCEDVAAELIGGTVS